MNRSSSAVASEHRTVSQPVYKHQAPAVNVVFSNGTLWVRSADILDIFYGGWGNMEVEED